MADHRVAVLLVTNEGFYRVDGGVARYVRNILDARAISQEVAAAHGVDLSWHVAERTLGGRVDDAALEQAMEQYIRPGHVEFHPLVDPRRSNSEPDHLEHFVALGAAVGQLVAHLARSVDSVLVVGGMSMFSIAPRFVLRAADQLGLRVSYVHMTHNPVISAHGGADRPEAYSDAVMGHLARSDERVNVGWESAWMRRQYASVYGIDEDDMIFARAGVPTSDAKFRRQSDATVHHTLRALGVPLDRPLALSWGRAGAGKGFSLLVRACRAIDDRVVPVVLNPVPNQSLAHTVAALESSAVLLDGQDDDVISALCQWEGTLTATFLSWGEAASVTPIEAALMSDGGGSVVSAVPTGVYRELVVPGRNGVLAEDRSVEGVARMLDCLTRMPLQERVRLGAVAAEDARRHHDFATNWRTTLNEALGRHLHVISRSAAQRRDLQRQRFLYAPGPDREAIR